MKKLTTLLLKTFVLVSFVFITTLDVKSQTFRVQSATISANTTDSCTSVQVDVLTWLGCINWTNRGSMVVINNNVIDVQAHFTSSFICAGAISQPMFTATLSNLDTGTYTVTASAYTDNALVNSVTIGLLTVSPCSTVGIDDNSQVSEINFYPNPAKNIIHLSTATKNEGNFSYKILDLNGRAVKVGNVILKQGKAVLNLEDLASGNYVINLIQSGLVLSEQITVQ